MKASLVFLVLPALCLGQWAIPEPDQAAGYSLVHLFEWKWSDVANECETFLGPKGYGGVQISPPQDCIISITPTTDNPDNRPWWERYQVCSYLLTSRSGTEADFIDMVARCNNVGVRIYVDTVINHMTGDHATAECMAGTTYDYDNYDYPAVPYTEPDFNTYGCQINYSDADSVRNCELLGMRDLDQSETHVQDMISDYMNLMTSYGVAGFRIDAAKHMWPDELGTIYSMLNDLSTTYFSPGLFPYIYQEVIEDSEIDGTEYTPYGRVTEFDYSEDVGRHFKGKSELQYLYNLGEEWGYLNRGYAIVFVDNHDNQRGDSSGNIVTHKDPWRYKMASGFHLAWDYADRRIMSSYYFDEYDQGPPQDSNGNIQSPTFLSDGSCDSASGWVCEHRWRQIYNMIAFRNDVIGTSVENWWNNTGDQIAFSRGDMGFIAFNQDTYDLDQTIQTGLPAGTYCDVISGDMENGSCTGGTITVNSDGTADIYIAYQPNKGSLDPDGFIAIHQAKKIA